MEIKIDTEKDSKEDLKKMILFLQRLVDETSTPIKHKHADIFGNDTGMTSAPASPMNMFGSTPTTNAPSPCTPTAAPMSMFDSIPSTDSVTKTEMSAEQLLNDPVTMNFDKDDHELEEVQELREKSETKAEDLRVISYK
ncbi:MAG: hypothetical protein KKG59_03965 [Nanoarchaeota archaeon]|nr:hypothetical protein [Nanoarchaeota archaeon]